MTKMLTAYSLRAELERNVEHLKQVQSLSLDATRPEMGHSPRLGLYGSEEWWRNVETGVIAGARYTGVITETFYAGMDTDRRHNSFRMLTDDGREYADSMRSEIGSHRGLYRVGHRIDVATIFLELKSRNADGTAEMMEIPVEIKLATKPLKRKE